MAQVFIPYAHWACKDFYDSETTSTGTDFSRGTFSNTNVSGNSVVLSVGQTSGTYTSRVYDIFGGCSPLQTWQKFQWKTNQPYGKEIVPSSETAVDYSDITAGLTTGIVEAFRFNGTIGNIASGTTITATIGPNGKSGDGGGTTMKYAAGKLGTAISLDGTNDSVHLTGYTQTAVSDYSISVWFKTATAGNGVMVQNRGSGAGASLTLGIGNNPGGCAAGRLSFGLDTNTVYYGQCTNTSYNDGNWHHVVGVWDGTSGAAVATNQFTIYVDGAVVASTAVTAGTAPNAPLTGLGNTRLGYHQAWSVYYAGLMDETIIWTRPLTATEVLQLYQRGGNNVRFQLKTCNNSNCSDVATWKGPDNTASSYFSELNNNLDQVSATSTVLTEFPSMLFINFAPTLIVDTKRYFQYQATLSTDNSTIQPSFHTSIIHHGCAPNTVVYTADATFTLPKLCTAMTITALGAGGGAGSSQGGGNKAAAGVGGRAVRTFTGLTPLTQYQISVGQGGICAQTGGSGGAAGYSGGDGALVAAGTAGNGTAGWGGAAGAGGASGFNGAIGAFGGGGGGAGNGPGGGDGSGGGGGASSVRTVIGSTLLIMAGGGGASGGSKTGTAGAGGAACGGAVSGDYTRGSNGGNASGNQSGGGGGGGACYCQGGCTSAAATGAAGGDNAGNTCQVSNNGAAGSVTITYQ